MSVEGRPSFWLQSELGITIERTASDGESTVTIDDRHRNPQGVAHGSIVFSLLDNSMGAAATGALPDGSWVATIELQTRFLEPVFSGTLIGRGTVLKAGRRVVQVEGTVHDDDGRLVATGSGSFAVITPGL